jgi:hypothetical protein
MVTLAEIYNWFMTGKKPTQAQFWASWGSFWNKLEQIPQSAIAGLTAVLNAKAEKSQFDTHKTDETAHAAILVEPNARITALEAKTDSSNNFKFIPNPGYTFDPVTRVLTMAAGWIGTINDEDNTNVATQEFPAIALSNAGYSRIELIVFKEDSTFEKLVGAQSTTTPVAPVQPANTLEAMFLTVGDGVVNVPVTPKPKAPVTSVQGMRGDVILKVINDLVTGGITDFLSAEQGKVLKTQINAINTLLTSDNVNLDNVQELVDAIETIQTSLSTILVNDLTTGGTTKALTAEMGKTLKALIDGLNTNKVDKVAGERLINAAEITKLAAVTNVTTTVKTITSASLATQDVAGFVAYINALAVVLVVGANEIVEYQLSDTGRLFKLLLRGRSFGVGQAAIVAADVEEITLWMAKDLRLSNYPNTRDDGGNPTNKVLSTDVNGNLKMYSMTGFPAPYLSEMIPESNLPSTTFNILLKGDFFTPNMTIVYAGQTVVSKSFISSKEYRISLTTGSAEGSFSVTLNNGVSITYPNAFLVVLGTTYIPVIADFISVSPSVDVQDGKISTNTVNTVGSAKLNLNFDMTKKWRVYLTIEQSPLIAPSYSEYLMMQIENTDTLKKFNFVYRTDGQWINVNEVDPNVNIGFAMAYGTLPGTPISFFIEWNLVTIRVFYNNALFCSLPNGAFGANFSLTMFLLNKNIKGIKYVLLPM